MTRMGNEETEKGPRTLAFFIWGGLVRGRGRQISIPQSLITIHSWTLSIPCHPCHLSRRSIGVGGSAVELFPWSFVPLVFRRNHA
jgi:hypothetical protein